MKVVESFIRNEADGTISFGDFSKSEKCKVSDFEHSGDLYKVKTFGEITKLERNDKFVYESVPGSAVFGFRETDDIVSFSVTAAGDVQITLELEPSRQYGVTVGGVNFGQMESNVGGKLIFSVDASADSPVEVRIIKK